MFPVAVKAWQAPLTEETVEFTSKAIAILCQKTIRPNKQEAQCIRENALCFFIFIYDIFYFVPKRTVLRMSVVFSIPSFFLRTSVAGPPSVKRPLT